MTTGQFGNRSNKQQFTGMQSIGLTQPEREETIPPGSTDYGQTIAKQARSRQRGIPQRDENRASVHRA